MMGLDAAERLGSLRVWSNVVVGNIITATHPVCVWAGGCITYQYIGVVASAVEAACVGIYSCATLIAGPLYIPASSTIRVEEMGDLKTGNAGDSLIGKLSAPSLSGGSLSLFAKKK